MVKALALALLLASPWCPPAARPAPASAPEVTLEVPGLSLRFTTPEKWRLAPESSAEELLLLPGKSKTTPLLRVRAFYGNFSAPDRLPEMTRGLSEEEAGVVFSATETWELEGEQFETARAIHAQGVGEWHALFTLVDQPGKLQHGFWLFGRKQDLERRWPAVQASIASAAVLASGDAPRDAREERARPPKTTEAVWSDAGLGVRLAAWPAGFAPDPKSLKLLAKQGLRLVPEDERANASTQFLLRATPGSAPDAADAAAATLHTELEGDTAVRELRRVPVRVGGQKGSLIKWVAEERSGAFAHETYLVQRDDLVLRIEFRAEEDWARARSRRTLVKDFVAGVGLE